MMFEYVYIQVGKMVLKLMPVGYSREMRCSTAKAVARELPLESFLCSMLASVSLHQRHTKL